jgi:hypothetical protein
MRFSRSISADLGFHPGMNLAWISWVREACTSICTGRLASTSSRILSTLDLSKPKNSSIVWTKRSTKIMATQFTLTSGMSRPAISLIVSWDCFVVA